MPNEQHVPIVAANVEPFRVVCRPEDAWAPTLDDINQRTYDYVKLHRLSGFVDIGIAPFSLGVAFDGTFILPATRQFRASTAAWTEFNAALAALLLGGVYVEALSPLDISYGHLTYDGYTRLFGGGSGPVAAFHQGIRTKHAGVIDSIRLLDPPRLEIGRLQEAYAAGKALLASIPRVSPELALIGCTFFVKRQWSEALNSLWTCVEQVTDHVWHMDVIARAGSMSVPGRADYLKDHRSWPVAARLELLFQRSKLQAQTYALLATARRARNALVHNGRSPTRDEAVASLAGLFQFISFVASEFSEVESTRPILETITARERADPLHHHAGPIQGVTHWLPLPPVPGDDHWGDKPYEIIEELRLQPLKHED